MSKPASDGTSLPRYDVEKELCKKFLREYVDETLNDQEYGKLKYLSEIQKIYDRSKRLLEIHIEDLEEFYASH